MHGAARLAGVGMAGLLLFGCAASPDETGPALPDATGTADATTDATGPVQTTAPGSAPEPQPEPEPDGTASPEPDDATDAASESPAEDEAGDVREVTVDIAGGEITPPVGRVEVAEGDTVRLVVTSDVEDMVHVHGFDIEGPVGPGEPFEAEFTADRTGQFEVETHDAGQVLLFLLVR